MHSDMTIGLIFFCVSLVLLEYSNTSIPSNRQIEDPDGIDRCTNSSEN